MSYQELDPIVWSAIQQESARQNRTIELVGQQVSRRDDQRHRDGSGGRRHYDAVGPPSPTRAVLFLDPVPVWLGLDGRGHVLIDDLR